MTSSDTRARVDDIIFNETLRRFTQDSPVLGDVWQEYMALAVGGRGDERVDLLLEPHRRSSPEALCEALRVRLCGARETTRRQRLSSPPKYGVGLSFNDSHVVARLSLGELIRAALPLTKWWHDYVWEPTAASGKRLNAGTIRSKATRHGLAARLDAVGVRSLDGAAPRQEAGYARLLWLLRVVGTIAFYGDGGAADETPTGTQLVEALWKTVQGMDTGAPMGDEHDLWSVSRNRVVDVSTWKSVVSTKADAATRLFDLSCSKLTWAVIDSGIDATHPAFRRRQGDKAVELDREAIGRCTRVKKTYDFNLLRELTQVEIDDDVDGLAHLSRETRATVQELRQGLRSGRIIDWGGLESALQLTTGGRTPMSEHGTHVAGILAGDWRDGDDEDEAPPKARLHGMCPDLTLYDLRVLNDEGAGSEFSVLAALQFVRYLNSGKNQPVIDGVNVSMSIRHDVANYACGRTPVCDECERVVASGVVVVAAAGNAGYGTGEGGQSYEAISITDPGNAEEVITVGATHRSKPHTYGVSYFSSRGPTGDGRCKPDLVAPGEKIMAPVPHGGAKALDGTSMAAPHVSGAAALLMAGHPELRGEPARIKQILCESATDLGRERNFQGHGMVDILRALQAV